MKILVQTNKRQQHQLEHEFKKLEESGFEIIPFGYYLSEDLKSYIYGFQMWDKDICLSWDETKEWFDLLNITPVEEVYRGLYSDKIVKDLFDNLDKSKEEGLVIRLASDFKYKDFKKSVAKLVRKDHIADGNNHWRFRRITPNLLEEIKEN